MKINLKDDKYVEVTIRKSENDLYQYYLGDIFIGIYDVSSMKDSKFLIIDLEKNNTIENKLSAESKDEITQVIEEIKEKIDKINLKEIQEEAIMQEKLDRYIEELGIDDKSIISITKIDIEKDKDEKERKSEKAEEEKKGNSRNNY